MPAATPVTSTSAAIQTNSRLGMLDGYRAIAALLVLTTHVAARAGVELYSGFAPFLGRFDIGVALFFLLSGYLLYRPFCRSALVGTAKPSLRTYFRRRMWRIWPAYLAVALTVLLWLPTAMPSARNWWANLSLTQIYFSGTQVRGLTQTWSLATELAFYIALPVIAYFAGRRGRGDVAKSGRNQFIVLLAVGGLTVVLNASRMLLIDGQGRMGDRIVPYEMAFWLPWYLDWFAAGMLCCLASELLTRTHPPRWALRLRALAVEHWPCVGAAGAVFLLVTSPLGGQLFFGETAPVFVFTKHLLYLLCCTLFVLPGFLASDVRSGWGAFLNSPVMEFLGKISYGIFLWHLFFLELVAHVLGISNFSGRFILLYELTVPLTIAAAAVSWYLIEQPSLIYSHAPVRKGLLNRVRAFAHAVKQSIRPRARAVTPVVVAPPVAR